MLQQLFFCEFRCWLRVHGIRRVSSALLVFDCSCGGRDVWICDRAGHGLFVPALAKQALFKCHLYLAVAAQARPRELLIQPRSTWPRLSMFSTCSISHILSVLQDGHDDRHVPKAFEVGTFRFYKPLFHIIEHLHLLAPVSINAFQTASQKTP